MTFPSGWIAGDGAELNVAGPKEDRAVMVTSVPKTDMADDIDLDGFMEVMKSSFSNQYPLFRMYEIQDVTLDSLSGKQAEYTGMLEKDLIHGILTVVDQGDHFYQILAVTPDQKFHSTKKELFQIIKTFKIVQAKPASKAQAPDSTDAQVTLTSSDETMELTLTGQWEQMNVEEVDIQATDLTSSSVLFVLGHDFSKDSSLQQYYQFIVDNRLNDIENPTISEPQQLTVNGLPALQFEVSGKMTTNGMKMAFLITLIDSPKQYVRIMFGTVQSNMDQLRDGFAEAVLTYKESDK
ncbi:hypothetical protein J2TS4_43020 [Paenibacillus sp. J2TS4]|nr:hypothetical protein J2TS4_43020 [Paenibacillus sp. J2TS4]